MKLRSIHSVSGRVVATYSLCFLLLLLLDSPRFLLFWDRISLECPPASVVGTTVETLARVSGLQRLADAETTLLQNLTPTDTVGVRDNPASTHTEQDAPLSPALGTGDSSVPSASKPALSGAQQTTHSNVPNVPSLPDIPEQTSSEKTPSAPQSNPSTPPNQPEQGTPTTDTGLPVSPSTELTPKPSEPAGLPKQDKTTVLLIGDSMMMEGFGPVLQRTLRKRDELNVIRQGRYSTGLSRDDYFDWPKHLQELVTKHSPDIILICMGANDAQDIIDATKQRHHVDSASWAEIYQKRAENLLAIATAQGSRVLWIGLPIMSKQPYAKRIERLSKLQEAACAQFPQARFVDSTGALADAQGNYTTFMTDSRGRHIRLRYKDMVHVTEDGGQRLTDNALPAFEQVLKEPRLPHTPAAPAESDGTTVTLGEHGQHCVTLHSPHLKNPLLCEVFLPQPLPTTALSTVYLLYSDFHNQPDWDHPLRTILSRLSTKTGMALVLMSSPASTWFMDQDTSFETVEQVFLQDVVPSLETRFRLLPVRGLLGLATGSNSALLFAAHHPDRYRSVSSMSGLVDITQHPDAVLEARLGALNSNRDLWYAHSAQHTLQKLSAQAIAAQPPLLITVGQHDTLSLAENRSLRDTLRRRGFRYQYRESPGRYGLDYWKTALTYHLAFHQQYLGKAASQ